MNDGPGTPRAAAPALPGCGAAVPVEPVPLRLPPGAAVREAFGLRLHGFGAGPPCVLVPGLAAGVDSLAPLLRGLAPRLRCHAVTLPGFDGVPPGPSPQLPAYERALGELVGELSRAQPVVLVGHSLGGVLALAVALQRPQAVRAVVALDALPAVAELAGCDGRAAAVGAALQAEHAAHAGEALRLAHARRLRASVASPAVADALLPAAMRSDVATTAAVMAQVLCRDLRPAMPQLAVPLLAIVALAAFRGPARERARTIAASQFAPVPALRLLALDHARHFVMLDAPAAVLAAITALLDDPPRPRAR
ncbi:MAG: alpha/beta hydrolase [Nannocystaceae bacterium]